MEVLLAKLNQTLSISALHNSRLSEEGVNGFYNSDNPFLKGGTEVSKRKGEGGSIG